MDGRSDAQARIGRKAPPAWMWLVLAAGGAGVGIAHGTELLKDRAEATVATLLCAAAAAVMLVVWYSFFSANSRRFRMLVFLAFLAAIATFFAVFRLDHFTGELWPVFVLRWSHKPDELLQAPAEGLAAKASSAADISMGTEHDFPQFLGPNRSNSVDHVKLARDWGWRSPQLVWRREIGAGWSAFSVVHGHAVTMEQRGPWEMVTCYNVQTGELEWADSIEARYDHIAGGVGPRSTPTIDEGLVYTLGATGRLRCLDGATGQCRWEKDLLEEYHISPKEEAANLTYGRSNSPLVAGDLVVVPAGGPSGGPYVSLVAYHKKTGALVWEGGSRQISYSSPVLTTLGGVLQIVIVNEDNVTGHDIKTGKVLWEHPWDGKSDSRASVSQAVPALPDRVFLSKAYGLGAALVQLSPAEDGAFGTKTVWENRRVMKTKFSNVAVKDGFVYGLSDGVLECVELNSGRRMWREGRYHQGQIMRVGGLLLVLAEAGEVLLIEATPDRPNQILGRFQALKGMTWNNIALYGPYLLVRNAQQAACYQLPLEER